MVDIAHERTIVALSGSPQPISRTVTLVSRIAAAVADRISADVRSVHVSDAARHLLPALSRDAVSPEGERILRAIETSDLLIVGTPVYRGSYTGALKHIFDLIDREALVGRVTVLAAASGTLLHGLVGEHQLRPLLGFFRAVTVPTVLYSTEEDIKGAELSKPLLARIEQAADEAAALYGATQPLGLRADPHRARA